MYSCLKTIKNIDRIVNQVVELSEIKSDRELPPISVNQTVNSTANDNEFSADYLHKQNRDRNHERNKDETDEFFNFLLDNVKAFEDAMCDDLNTPQALRCFFNILRRADQLLISHSSSQS